MHFFRPERAVCAVMLVTMISFLEDLGDAGYRQEMENKKRWERSHAVILQLLKSLSPCLRWVLSFFIISWCICLILLLTPLVLFVLQCQKLREVFNLDYPHSTFLLKTLTVVSGPDMVDLTFHNFVSYKENVGKVCGPEGREALWRTKSWHVPEGAGKELLGL